MKIGEVVQKYREEHYMSQREFARKCGISSAIISFLERGERTNGDPYLPRFDTIRKIARAMGISPETLVSQCEDFDIDISVGPEETPIIEDFIAELRNRNPDEDMLIQAYRRIPQEYRIEAMQALLDLGTKHRNL